uniref:DCD domain-containing protein n=1 Tax=Oryza rufipogon TaxID=4529 RepID=A0A0E0PI07_ORYRU
MQGQHLNSQTVDLARNLRENQLGGVIFGCKHNTIEECFEKQLFGLPSVHYSYVRNVKPGLPLFLFNYSDRKLHGIFEAASPGQMCIDPYAWSHDGSLRTSFPAQVRICTKTRYPPLMESQFRTVLGDNYYNHHHFYFELDHAQTKALIAVFKSLAPANFTQVPAVSSKRTIAPLPSTKRQAPVIPDQKKGSASPKDINPFSVLSQSGGAVKDNWADSDVENGSISRSSDEKESRELVSDWEDLDDNVLHGQLGLCSNPDEISQNSSYNSVAKGAEFVECSHLVVNPVNGGIQSSDGDMLVISDDVHSGAVGVDGIESGGQNEPDDVSIQPERLSILQKLKELFVLRQQAVLSDQNLAYSNSDEYAPEETQANVSLSCPEQCAPEEPQANTTPSCPELHVLEETQANVSLLCPEQYVPEEPQANASLSCPEQHVPEEPQANASLSCPEQHVLEETQPNGNMYLKNHRPMQAFLVQSNMYLKKYKPMQAFLVQISMYLKNHRMMQVFLVQSNMYLKKHRPMQAFLVQISMYLKKHRMMQAFLVQSNMYLKKHRPMQAFLVLASMYLTMQAFLVQSNMCLKKHRSMQVFLVQISIFPKKQNQHVPEETQVTAGISCPDQHVPEETQVNASLPSPNQHVPEETKATAAISCPDQHVTQANASLSQHEFGAKVEDNTSLEQNQGNAELIKIVLDLIKKTDSLDMRQNKSHEEILSLKEVVKDSGTKVKQLEYRIDELQFKLDSSLSLVGDACDTLDKPSIFLIGGYNGVSWLSSLDAFSPEKDILVPLAPLSSARSYASVATLEGCIFVCGGGVGDSFGNTVECYNTMCNEWMACPCLNNKKGSLAAVSLDGKIYAIGGGDGIVTYSDVEMFDPFLGKWICSPSMMNSRFALGAAEMNSVIYATGGFDGFSYLQSAERYDPREGFWARLPSMNVRRGCHTVAALGGVLYAIGGYNGDRMVSSVEIFDPRRNSWRVGDPMNFPRGYASTVTLGDNVFVIGGLQSSEKFMDSVEVYNVKCGWSVPGFSSIGVRCFASAAVV